MSPSWYSLSVKEDEKGYLVLKFFFINSCIIYEFVTLFSLVNIRHLPTLFKVICLLTSLSEGLFILHS